MKQRTQNPKCRAYRNYGARGITTCEAWQKAALPKPEPTAEDDTNAMMVDHEYRLTLLELGLNE